MGVETNQQGAHHVNCCAQTAKCQAKDRSSTKSVPILRRGNFSALGTAGQTCERHADKECKSVPLSVLSLSTNISTLSRREHKCSSDRTVTAVCHTVVELGTEPSSQQFDFDRIESNGRSYVDLAGCAGRCIDDEKTQVVVKLK